MTQVHQRPSKDAVPTPDSIAPSAPEKSKDGSARKLGRSPTCSTTPARRPQKRTMADTVLRLLQRPAGASIAHLTRATGWQAHSIRAALTGLRKKGHVIHRTTGKSGQAVYRIEAQS